MEKQNCSSNKMETAATKQQQKKVVGVESRPGNCKMDQKGREASGLQTRGDATDLLLPSSGALCSIPNRSRSTWEEATATVHPHHQEATEEGHAAQVPVFVMWAEVEISQPVFWSGTFVGTAGQKTFVGHLDNLAALKMYIFQGITILGSREDLALSSTLILKMLLMQNTIWMGKLSLAGK